MTRWIASVGTGLLLALAVLFFGPKKTVVCEHTSWPNSMFGDTFGHTDGADFTGCAVPTTLTWVLVGAVAVAPPVAFAVSRRQA